MSKTPNHKNVVREGGTAEPSDVEDLTPDTYGNSQAEPVDSDPSKRVAEAN